MRWIYLHLVRHAVNTGRGVGNLHGLQLYIGAGHIAAQGDGAIRDRNFHVCGASCIVRIELGLNVAGKRLIIGSLGSARQREAPQGHHGKQRSPYPKHAKNVSS